MNDSKRMTWVPTISVVVGLGLAACGVGGAQDTVRNSSAVQPGASQPDAGSAADCVTQLRNELLALRVSPAEANRLAQETCLGPLPGDPDAGLEPEPPITDGGFGIEPEPPITDGGFGIEPEPPITDGGFGIEPEPPITDGGCGIEPEPPITDGGFGIEPEPPITDGGFGIEPEPPITDGGFVNEPPLPNDGGTEDLLTCFLRVRAEAIAQGLTLVEYENRLQAQCVGAP